MYKRQLRVLSLGTVKGSTITDAKALDTGHTVELERSEAIPLPLHVASAYLTVLFGVFWSYFFLNLLGMVAPWLHLLMMALQVHMLAMVPAYLLRRQSWAWLIHPAVALVTIRDMLMAEGTVRMLREHPDPSAAIVVMGRAHLVGYERELVEKHGFTRVTLDD